MPRITDNRPIAKRIDKPKDYGKHSAGAARAERTMASTKSDLSYMSASDTARYHNQMLGHLGNKAEALKKAWDTRKKKYGESGSSKGNGNAHNMGAAISHAKR
jgi:hypothetical protein